MDSTPPTIKYRYHSLSLGCTWASALHYYLTTTKSKTNGKASLPNTTYNDEMLNDATDYIASLPNKVDKAEVLRETKK